MICFRGCFSVRVSTCLFIFTLCGRIIGALNEPVKVVVMEESDVILPCSLSTKENIEFERFDWKKDGQKEVFLYDAGIHYNNGRSGQDPQFKGRVFHFQDELKHGIASIIIIKMTLADSGNYTCDFPRLQPSQTFLIELFVGGIFKDRRVENIPGAASEPYVTVLDQTNDGMLLQCVVRGVFPKPDVEWKDGSGNIVPAEEAEITERGGSYDIILQTTVTKTDHYRCVVTQEEIYHQVDSKIFVRINEEISEGAPTGWIFAVSVLSVVVLLFVVWKLLKCFCKKGRRRHENSSEERPAYDHKQGNGLRTDPEVSYSAQQNQQSGPKVSF